MKKELKFKDGEVYVNIKTDLSNRDCKNILNNYKLSEKEEELLNQGYFININLQNNKGFDDGFCMDKPDANTPGRPLIDEDIKM